VVGVFLLTGALVSAQICDYHCLLYACQAAAPVPAAGETNAHSHCHQHGAKPLPQQHNHAPACPTHFDATTPARAAVKPASAAIQIPITQGPATPTFTGNAAGVESPRPRSQAKPDRSPPSGSVLRI